VRTSLSQLPRAEAAAKFDAALVLHRQGRLAEAEAIYLEILALAPRHAQASHHAGIIALQLGRIREAITRFQVALDIVDSDPALHANFALALARSRRTSDALSSLDRALLLNPRFVGAMVAKGNILLDIARPAEALALFQQALALATNDVAAINGAGLALLDLGPAAEAVPMFTRAMEEAPGTPIYVLNRALAYSKLRMPADALRDCQRSRALGHVTAQLCFVEGVALMDLGRQDEAVAAFESAIMLEPTMAKAFNNHGSALVALNQHDLAVQSFDGCLGLIADQGATELWRQALLSKCSSLKAIGRRSEAQSGLEELLRVSPDYPFVRGMALHERLTQFDWRDYGSSVAAIQQAIGLGTPADAPFHFLAVADSPELQLCCAKLFVSTTTLPRPPKTNSRRHRTGRLRVAYLSSDFRTHAVSILMAGVFESHDRQLIETIAVSTGEDDGSYLRRRIAESCDHFLDVAGAPDAAIAARMTELDIQVAVDLNGHTLGGRLGLLALRPAPVQVSYLGFPGGMGCDFIDYLIADEFVVPPDTAHWFSEKIIYIPGCFQPNDDRRVLPIPCSRVAAGLPETGFVFCAFNSSYKINPMMFDIWCRLLRATPGSVLWVTSPGVRATENLVHEASARGVDAGQLVFADHRPYTEHLSRIAHADLFLDTLPFNGGTTASDFLWVGVPVLTCTGKSFAARMAGSLLRAVQLPELIAENLTDYERLALELAHNPTKLAELRAKLATVRTQSPLFNTHRICRSLEAAYCEIWARHERGDKPVTIYAGKC